MSVDQHKRNRDPYHAGNVRRGLWHYLNGRAIQGVMSFGVMVLLVRYMSVDDYARYVAAMGAATLLAALSKFGLDRVITRYLPEGRLQASINDLKSFLRNLRLLRLLTVGLMAASLTLFWPLVAKYLKLPPGYAMLAAVAAFTLSHAFTSFQRINLQSLMLQKGLRKATSVLWIFRLAGLLAILGLVGHIDVQSALWIATLSECMGLLWMARVEAGQMRELSRHEAPEQISRGRWPESWADIRRFAGHNYRSQLAGLPSKGPMLRVLGAIFLPPYLLAAYGFYQTLADTLRVYLPVEMFKTLFEPVVLGRYSQDRDFDRLNAAVSTVLKLNLLILLPFMTWFLVAGDGVVQLLAGGKYLSENWMLPASVAAIAASSHWVVLVIVANAVGASNRLVWGPLAGSAIALLVMAATLPEWGAASLILAAAAAGIMTNFIVAGRIRRQGFAYRVEWASYARMLGWAGLSGLIAWWVVHWAGIAQTLPGSAVALLATGAVFFGAHLKWKAFNANERELLDKLTGRYKVPF